MFRIVLIIMAIGAIATTCVAKDFDVIDGCIVVNVRGSSPASSRLKSMLARFRDSGSAAKYEFMVPTLAASAGMAADGYRRIDLELRQPSIKVAVVPSRDLQAMILLPTRQDVEIIITTGLIDVVEATTFAIVAEALERQSTGLPKAAEGFNSWIAELARRGGAPCEATIPWPTRDTDLVLSNELRTKIQREAVRAGIVPAGTPVDHAIDRFLLTRVFAMSLFQFIFAHEYAHTVVGSSDGTRVREKECDAMAFRALRAAQRSDPAMVVLLLMTLAHYDSLQGPLIRELRFRSERRYVELRTGRDWLARARTFMREWEVGEAGHEKEDLFYSKGWKELISGLRSQLRKPLPDPCSMSVDQRTDLRQYVVLELDDITWDTSASVRTVAYDYSIRNLHPYAKVRLELQVLSAYGPRDDPDHNLKIHQQRRHRLVLDPGDSERIDGALEWWRDARTMPVLREELVNGSIDAAGAHQNDAIDVEDAADYRAALQALCKSTAAGYRELRSAEPSYESDGTKWFDMPNGFPMSSSPSIILEDGRYRARVDLDGLARSIQSPEAAVAAFEHVIELTRLSLPDDQQLERKAKDWDDKHTFTASFSSELQGAAVEVSLNYDVEDGEFEIDISVEDL